MPKTVFFGGTFNPPHISHRLMLEAVAGLDDVEKVLVVPTNIPPHKSVAEFTASEEDRLFMCRLLTEGVEKAEVSDIEFRRGGKSYSFDTLTELKPMYDKLDMLIGGDMITTFTSWYRYLDILKLCGIIAVRRKGIDDVEFDKAVEDFTAKKLKVKKVEEVCKLSDNGKNVVQKQEINISQKDKREAQIRSFFGCHFKEKIYVERKEDIIELLMTAKTKQEVNNGLLKFFSNETLSKMLKTMAPFIKDMPGR